jgi:hypothetical protein
VFERLGRGGCGGQGLGDYVSALRIRARGWNLGVKEFGELIRSVLGWW